MLMSSSSSSGDSSLIFRVSVLRRGRARRIDHDPRMMRAMRTLSHLVVLAACGGTSPPPRHSQPAPAERNEQLGGVEENRQPAPPPKPRPSSLVPRLRDADGPVPGLDAIETRLERDPYHCSGFAVVPTVHADKPIAKDEQPLAELYLITSPHGLNFSDEKIAASRQRFDDWLAKLIRLSSAANDHYNKALATADARAKVIALARFAQIRYRAASLLLRMEIPIDLRSGEFAADKMEAFCEKLEEVAGPLLTQAEEAAAGCATAARAVPAGWWTAICKAP